MQTFRGLFCLLGIPSKIQHFPDTIHWKKLLLQLHHIWEEISKNKSNCKRLKIQLSMNSVTFRYYSVRLFQGFFYKVHKSSNIFTQREVQQIFYIQNRIPYPSYVRPPLFAVHLIRFQCRSFGFSVSKFAVLCRTKEKIIWEANKRLIRHLFSLFYDPSYSLHVHPYSHVWTKRNQTLWGSVRVTIKFSEGSLPYAFYPISLHFITVLIYIRIFGFFRFRKAILIRVNGFWGNV